MMFASTLSSALLLALASRPAGATLLSSTKFLTSTSQSGSGGPGSSESYFPNSLSCGKGTTCDGACGSGFSDCSGGVGYQGCYDEAAGATCCSHGVSCDAGWYCYPGSATRVLCCPEGMGQDECARDLVDSGGRNATTTTTTAPAASGGDPASSTPTGTSVGNATTSSSSRGFVVPSPSPGSMLAMLGFVAAGAALL